MQTTYKRPHNHNHNNIQHQMQSHIQKQLRLHIQTPQLKDAIQQPYVPTHIVNKYKDTTNTSTTKCNHTQNYKHNIKNEYNMVQSPIQQHMHMPILPHSHTTTTTYQYNRKSNINTNTNTTHANHHNTFFKIK